MRVITLRCLGANCFRPSLWSGKFPGQAAPTPARIYQGLGGETHSDGDTS